MYIIERYLSMIYLILNFYHNIFKSESIPISRNRNILLSIPIFIVIFSKAEHAATYALWPFPIFPIFDAENRNILLSYSFYFSTSTAGSVHRVFVRLTEKKGQGRAKVSHSESKGSSLDSRKIRSVGVMRYWAAYTSSTRAIPYRAAIPREKFRTPETRPLHKH